MKGLRLYSPISRRYESPMNQLWSRDFDSFFDNFDSFLGGDRLAEKTRFSPACDIEETEGSFVLSFDLPGVAKDDVQIDVNGNTWTVSAKRQDKTEEKKSGYYRSERFQGEYQRAFQLGDGINPEQIEASMQDGVLYVNVPKKEITAAKKIEIQSGKKGFLRGLLGKKEDASAETEAAAIGNK